MPGKKKNFITLTNAQFKQLTKFELSQCGHSDSDESDDNALKAVQHGSRIVKKKRYKRYIRGNFMELSLDMYNDVRETLLKIGKLDHEDSDECDVEKKANKKCSHKIISRALYEKYIRAKNITKNLSQDPVSLTSRSRHVSSEWDSSNFQNNEAEDDAPEPTQPVTPQPSTSVNQAWRESHFQDEDEDDKAKERALEVFDRQLSHHEEESRRLEEMQEELDREVGCPNAIEEANTSNTSNNRKDTRENKKFTKSKEKRAHSPSPKRRIKKLKTKRRQQQTTEEPLLKPDQATRSVMVQASPEMRSAQVQANDTADIVSNGYRPASDARDSISSRATLKRYFHRYHQNRVNNINTKLILCYRDGRESIEYEGLDFVAENTSLRR